MHYSFASLQVRRQRLEGIVGVAHGLRRPRSGRRAKDSTGMSFATGVLPFSMVALSPA